jgi:hypothetical protein
MMSASVPEHELFDVTIVRNLQQSVPPADTETAQFNPAVFWSINAVWITLLIAVAVWIWKFHGAQRLSNWSQSLMAQDSGEQGNEETQQQTIPPEKRRKLLSDYFRTSRVHMVSKFDIGFSIAFLGFHLSVDSCWTAAQSPSSQMLRYSCFCTAGT